MLFACLVHTHWNIVFLCEFVILNEHSVILFFFEQCAAHLICGTCRIACAHKCADCSECVVYNKIACFFFFCVCVCCNCNGHTVAQTQSCQKHCQLNKSLLLLETTHQNFKVIVLIPWYHNCLHMHSSSWMQFKFWKSVKGLLRYAIFRFFNFANFRPSF